VIPTAAFQQTTDVTARYVPVTKSSTKYSAVDPDLEPDYDSYHYIPADYRCDGEVSNKSSKKIQCCGSGSGTGQ
jgi:hypothetical protein